MLTRMTRAEVRSQLEHISSDREHPQQKLPTRNPNNRAVIPNLYPVDVTTDSPLTPNAIADAIAERLLASEPGDAARSWLSAFDRTLRTAQGDFAVRALREHRTDRLQLPAALVVVVLERVRNTVDATMLLHDNFGLTRREATVASLLAHRDSNVEIARKLGISQHTARHHVERVLRKVGARTRADAADRLKKALHG